MPEPTRLGFAVLPGLLVVLLLGVLPGTAPRALAADEDASADALALVAALERAVDDPSGDWKTRWKAYKEAKEGIAAATGEEQARADAAYLAIRPKVAAALRRTRLDLMGWLMGFVGAVLLWGGFAWHVRIAMKSKGPKHPEPLTGEETWPLRPEDEASS